MPTTRVVIFTAADAGMPKTVARPSQRRKLGGETKASSPRYTAKRAAPHKHQTTNRDNDKRTQDYHMSMSVPVPCHKEKPVKRMNVPGRNAKPPPKQPRPYLARADPCRPVPEHDRPNF